MAWLAAAVIAAPAFAQAAKTVGAAMSVAELKVALFGIDMQGYSPSDKFSWRECIDPKGDTLYQTPSGVLHGRLTITPGGKACFSYEDDNYSTISCFTTTRTKDGFRFAGEYATLFVANKVVTGVKSCKPNDLVS